MILLDFKSGFTGFNLLVFAQRDSWPESGVSWKLSYEVTKLSDSGGGNPVISRAFASKELKGGAMAKRTDGKGGRCIAEIMGCDAELG